MPGPPQQALLLAVLVANVGRPVSASELTRLLWGEAAPATAVNALHKYVSALRRLLEPTLGPRESGGHLQRRGDAYVFTGEAAAIDLVEFRAAVADALRASGAGRLEAALNGYVAALHLWDGPAAGGLTRGVLPPAIFAELDAEVESAVVAATAVAVRANRPQEVLRFARRAADLDPTNEAVQAAFISALAAAGQRAEALSRFRTVTAHLAEELGIDPGPGLQAVYREVLDPPLPEPRAPAHHRPATVEPQQLADFCGRLTELESIGAFLRSDDLPEPAVLVVSGPPGVGKTATVVEALRNEPARLFLNLLGVDPVPLTPLEVLRGLLGQANPGAEPPGTLDEASAAWTTVAATTPLVVVLDNAASEAQVRAVLVGQARVLVTSRRTLPGLSATKRIALGPLAPDDSAKLLATLLPLQTAPGELKELADLCGNFPLALRIAGSRVASRPNWTLGDFLPRLRDERLRIAELVAGDLAIDTAFSLSYDALDGPAKALFRGLSLLHGTPFNAELAASVDGLDVSVCRRRLDALVDLGLVEALRGDRYLLHDLLQVYAAERQREEVPAEVERAQRLRLNRWTLRTARDAALLFPDIWAPVPVPSSATDDELRRARGWLTSESSHWYAALIDAAALGEHELVNDTADALLRIASEWWQWGRWAEVHATAAESARLIGDQVSHVKQLIARASALEGEDADPESDEHPARRALAAAQELGDPFWIANCRTFVAEGYLAAGKPEAAVLEAQLASAAFAALGFRGPDLGSRAVILKGLAELDLDAALLLYEESVALIDELGPRPERAVQAVEIHNVFTSGLRVMFRLKRFANALAISRRMLQLPDNFLDGGFSALALRHQGFALLGLERFDEARAALESALALSGPYREQWWADQIEEALQTIRSAVQEQPLR
jgi:DNA-binding SARP family transcriptional activator/tetratricopeptide (TPR) repeat protein